MAKEKLTPADKKFITKFFGEVNFDATKTTRNNRFTGEEVDIDPVSALAFDFVMKLEPVINSQNEAALKRIHPDLKLSNVISNFDIARMLVLKMDSNAYMSLLD